ncbi:MAG: hypothetical protein F6K09_09420 [Merismopedia sp. SIO2A8]|nr:hypothetical protein [Merismopedia sp. SIO2A8]
MASSSNFTVTERLMSLKAAILGGLSAGTISLLLLVLHRQLIVGPAIASPELLVNMATLTLLVNGAIAALSGAVFSITYRYAVRQDTNVQLKMGVVFAFTLVRGLALVDVGSAVAQNFWPFFSACGESFLIFGLTAIILTFATQHQWITPFGQE